MKKEIETAFQALAIIAEMVTKFGQLYVLNISSEDWEQLQYVRDGLEKVIHDNGYRMNYDKNIKQNIIKR
ncbi:hypothetical protein EG339_20880 [Chryseobacterium bernardetii]|uniref:Uncharacterized protein n=2 Tax=Chryseobacterium bernardetii TaxID=1241978 RepID=A0A3G6TC85_9FLAO|nr:hypothetical protein [Chryseobacterium sp. JUb7]AZB26862.1 hypothetical protein EG339_20880 [Chryseobacterium bernardetii]MCS3531147.1 hypothetical protein [Chryseobacterium sp. JUb7]